LWAGFNVDAPVVVKYGPFHDWQSEAHSARLGCAEGREHLLLYFGIDSLVSLYLKQLQQSSKHRRLVERRSAAVADALISRGPREDAKNRVVQQL
jgi:hypothetical protein